MPFIIGILLAAAACSKAEIATLQAWDILMPNISIHQNDSFLCHSARINTDQPIYIAGIVPVMARNIQHDVLTACKEPGSHDSVWSCGGVVDPAYKYASKCAKNTPEYPLYTWDIDGEGVFLPPDVGFEVGGATMFVYLVIQVHYDDVKKSNNSEADTDSSGLRLYYTNERPQKLAGYMMLYTGLQLPPLQHKNSELACAIPLAKGSMINVIACHVHTHGLGLVVSSYRVRPSDFQPNWTEIARRSPQLSPHGFVSTNVNMTAGDFMTMRCTYYNPHSHVVIKGPKWEDEMCVVSAIYVTERGPHVPHIECYSGGPPYYYWRMEKRIDLSNPPAEASQVPTQPEYHGPDGNM